MIKIIFVCHGSTAGSRELAYLWGRMGQITAIEVVGYYGFTTIEQVKRIDVK